MYRVHNEYGEVIAIVGEKKEAKRIAKEFDGYYVIIG